MNQTAALLLTLKKYLKAQGITYKHLADGMGLSEASIKRMFSKQIFSLARLEKVCRIIDIDFYDLVIMDRERHFNSDAMLTIEQEQILANDEKLLIFLIFLVNGWEVPLIIQDYDYSESEAIQMLGKLEEIGILEHHPNYHIRLLISKNVFWQSNGPIWQVYHKIIEKDFLDSPFGFPNERYLFSSGQLSEASFKIICKKIDNLIKEYNQLAEMDSARPLKNRRSAAIFIGFRSWVLNRVAKLHRRSLKKKLPQKMGHKIKLF